MPRESVVADAQRHILAEVRTVYGLGDVKLHVLAAVQLDSESGRYPVGVLDGADGCPQALVAIWLGDCDRPCSAGTKTKFYKYVALVERTFT